MKAKEFLPIKSRFVELLPEDVFQREAGFAAMIIQGNKVLGQCTPESKLKAVLEVALTGLTLDTNKKFAYLVPRKGYNGWECHLQPSYQGVAKLVTDSGSVYSIDAHIVRECDDFKYSLGTNPEVQHFPCLNNKDSKIVAAYCVARLATGGIMIEVMSIDEIYEIRETSSAWQAFKAKRAKSCIWASHEGEMCRKTVVKRICKYLPKSENIDQLSRAIELDNSEYTASPGQLSMIESLVETASIDPQTKSQILREVNTYNPQQAEACISMLKEPQNESASDDQLAAVDDLLEKAKGRLNKSEYRSTELAIERGMTSFNAEALISWLSTKVEPKTVEA